MASRSLCRLEWLPRHPASGLSTTPPSRKPTRRCTGRSEQDETASAPPRPLTLRTRPSHRSACPPPEPGVHTGCQQDDRAEHHLLVDLIDTEQVEAVLDEGEQHDADDCAPDGALTSPDAGAADHDPGH